MSGMTQSSNILKKRFNKLVVGDIWDIHNFNSNTKIRCEVVARNTCSITLSTNLYSFDDNIMADAGTSKLNRKFYNELFGVTHKHIYFFPANN
jgi:hypothetical protein